MITAIRPNNEMFEKSKKNIPKSFFCSFCNTLMLCAYQLACGHLACVECRKRLEKQGTNSCPKKECQGADTSMKIYEDKCMTRRIQNFIINCKNEVSGCNWKGELTAYLKHMQTCDQDKSKFSQKSEDLVNDVEFIKGQVSTLTSEQLTTCNYCMKNNVLKSEIELHQRFDCPNFESPCPFTEVGCPEHQKKTQQNMLEHKRIGNLIHADLLLEDHLSLRRTCNDEFEKNYNAQKKWKNLEDDFKRTTKELICVTDKYEHRFFDIEQRLVNLEGQNGKKKDNCTESSIAKLGSRVDDIEVMLSCLQEDGFTPRRQGNSNERLRNIESTLEKYVLMTQELEKLCNHQNKQLSFRNARIESLEAQISASEPISYDGTLIWRITGLTEKRRDAITKKKSYILSPAFYSGPHGYKMMVRLYLHGDGQGKSTHVSIFFTLLKGPFDALLPWPFKQRVTFEILGHDGVNNFQDSFRPDTASPSFQRPKTEANISSGCPLFLPISALDSHSYVRDDCMFVKVTVENFTI